jgi:hypothetical protein
MWKLEYKWRNHTYIGKDTDEEIIRYGERKKKGLQEIEKLLRFLVRLLETNRHFIKFWCVFLTKMSHKIY